MIASSSSFFFEVLHPRKEREIHEGRNDRYSYGEWGASGRGSHDLHDIKKLPCAYIPLSEDYLPKLQIRNLTSWPADSPRIE
jgi:hypothetical protein